MDGSLPEESCADDATAEVRQLLSLGLANGIDEPPLKPGTLFGDYELGEVLGRGGMGVVYRAQHVGIHRSVALKLIRSGDLASEGEVLKFRAEAAANLDHPNIVPVFHFGECEGQPFFTMRWVEGGNLAEALERSRFTQRQALTLLAAVARAVHHAHQAGVLHRDLKPTNILLDKGGQPHVADFGIARRLGELAGDNAPGMVSGHPDYMAPEQALGESCGSVAADVYGLGVIFYEMLTGALPQRGTAYESPVPRPSAVEPRVLPALDLICLKCLEREPLLRYESASQLAEDLERCLRGELPEVRPRGTVTRLWWRLRHHPFLATAIAGALFVGVAAIAIALRVSGSQEHILRRDVLKINAYAAQATAGQVLFKLSELSDQLLRCATDEAAAARIGLGLSPHLEPASSEQFLRRCGAATTFDSIHLFDDHGSLLTGFPFVNAQIGRDYAFREYFQGAKRLGELARPGVHVGRAIKSEADDQYKISLAAPVFAGGRWLGVVLASIGTDSTLGSLQLPNDDRHMVILVGLRDRQRAEAALPQQHLVLIHHGLSHGQAVVIEGPQLGKLTRAANDGLVAGVEQFELSGPDRVLADDQHRDPLIPGRWLAAYAPVGNTGYAVIVQTAEASAVATIQTAVAELVGASGGLFALGMILVLFGAQLVSLRRRRALT